MARSLTASMVTEVTATKLNPFLAAKFAFAGGDVLAWSGIGDLTFGGKTFQGVGDFGGVSEVEETEELRAVNVTFRLAGVPSALVSTALSDAYQNRLATLWFGVLDDAGNVVADPYQVFQGRMDVMSIEDDGEESTILVSCESRLADLQRTAGWTYTTEDQKALGHTSDKFFEFVPRLQDQAIVWRDQPDDSGKSAPAAKQKKTSKPKGGGGPKLTDPKAAQQTGPLDPERNGRGFGGGNGFAGVPGRIRGQEGGR